MDYNMNFLDQEVQSYNQSYNAASSSTYTWYKEINYEIVKTRAGG